MPLSTGTLQFNFFHNFFGINSQIETVTSRRPYKRSVTPRHFGPGEGRVVRFYGRWLDPTGLPKDVRTLEIRYTHQIPSK